MTFTRNILNHMGKYLRCIIEIDDIVTVSVNCKYLYAQQRTFENRQH